jgi:hypothetical protein
MNVQLVNAGEDDSLYIPPPALVELAENVQLVNVGDDK